MPDLSFEEILAMQRALQAAHAHEWTPLSPEKGRGSLLWTVEEIGEMAAIIKKQGDAAIMQNPTIRAAFAEELSDVLMYLGDVMLCYNLTAAELSAAFRAKHQRNLARDYHAEPKYQKDS